MMIVRVMVVVWWWTWWWSWSAVPVNDSPKSFTGKEKQGGYTGFIRLPVGVLGSSSRIGKITLSGMNVIGPQACHKHIGLRLFLDYIVKGSKEISKNCLQFTAGCLEVDVYMDKYSICILLFILWEPGTMKSHPSLQEKNHSLTVECLFFFCHQQRTLWAPTLLLTPSNSLLSVTLSCNDTSTPTDVSISLCHFASDSSSLDSCSVDGSTFSWKNERRGKNGEGKKSWRKTKCGGWHWEQTCQTHKVSFSD